MIRDAEGLTYKKNMITIMEIMGRNAGWLTGATALSKSEDCEGPDLIYLPEVPFDIEKFLAKVKDLLKKKSSVVIAVSEGIKLADGRYVCELGSVGDYVDAFGHQAASGDRHLSCQLPGSRVRLQNPCRRTLHPSEKRFPHGIPGGY